MNTRRIGLLVTIALGLLTPLAAKMQQAARIPRIGFPFPTEPNSASPLIGAFREGLRDLGYVEGQNIGIEWRWAKGKWEQLADLGARNRLPAGYALREHAEAGGLMAYGASEGDMYRRTATYVDKILKGARPADLPVQQLT